MRKLSTALFADFDFFGCSQGEGLMSARVGPVAISRALFGQIAPEQRLALALELMVSVEDPKLFYPLAQVIRDADKHAQKLARKAFGMGDD